MSNFKGYLLKRGNTTLSNKYLKPESYKTTPNMREEIEAYRDDYTRALTRITAPGHVTKITFETIDVMELSDFITFKNFFTSATTNSEQRKVNLTYWNMEECNYKQTYFYVPDIEYTIRRIDEANNKMYIKSFTVSLVEYDPLNSTIVT